MSKGTVKKRYSNGLVKVSVFENEFQNDDGSIRTSRMYGVQKSYKDTNDEWQNSPTLYLTRKDLHQAAKLLGDIIAETGTQTKTVIVEDDAE